jgi:hypothetical protein|tara:strand:+ start:88 stop:384 length:297 start_codon:yes stop_codon:yes gene_type:complete
MASNIRKFSVVEASNINLGQTGNDYVTNATVNSNTYIAITALGTTAGTETTTVTATSSDTNFWDSLSAIEVPAGVTIFGKWSSVQIGSGDAAIVYRSA